jgi:CofD-related protein of GAK system
VEYIETKRGPVVQVQLNHPTSLPVYKKVHNYELHPKEGPPLTLVSGGTGARALSEALIRYTHSSSHVLPMFDDGGSSRELREQLGMPPPGDLRNRLMALSDMSMSGNPEVSRLFRTRLPAQADPEQLEQQLLDFLGETHPQMERIERRYRRIIINHLERFIGHKPQGFDLRGGNIGNFVIAGAYLSIGDLESVIFEFSALAAVRGQVYPVCTGARYHLKAELEDGSVWVGQSKITGQPHQPIRRLAVVEQQEDGAFVEARPPLNPLAAEAIRKTALVTFTMGSFYTSIVSNLLVDGMGQAVRETKRPKVFVANLFRDHETPQMTVSGMLRELWRYLRESDSEPGEMEDYVQYVLVGTHGDSAEGGRVPVDLEAVRELKVEPIILPLEQEAGGPAPRAHTPRVHDSELVAAVLISLC